MNLISLYIVIPLSLAALTTGLIQSLGTPWGLFRHYWVAVKFFLTLISVAVLLMHQYTAMAAAVRVASRAGGILPRAELAPIGFMLIRASGLGMLVLIIITTLSVYKPWGLTGRARRKQQAQLATSGKAGHSEGEDTPGFLNEPAREGFPRGLKIFLLASAGVLLAILIVSMHLTGNGFLYGH